MQGLCVVAREVRWSREDLDEKVTFERRLEGVKKASHEVISACAKALGQEFWCFLGVQGDECGQRRASQLEGGRS